MFIEIEETVCFIASHLYGKLPRSRVDAFSEHMANGLSERLYQDACRPATHFRLVVKTDGFGDSILHKAANNSFLNINMMLGLLPSELVIDITKGRVNAVFLDSGEERLVYPLKELSNKEMLLEKGEASKPKKGSSKKMGTFNDEAETNVVSHFGPCSLHRPQFHVEFSLPSGFEREATAVPRPFFEVQHEEQIYTAQAFVATRFGSTKLKTYQTDTSLDSLGHRYSSSLNSNSLGNPMASGSHPFTMPSVYAYLQLLVFLNAIACISMLPEDDAAEKSTKEGSKSETANSPRSSSSVLSSDRGSVTGTGSEGGSEEVDVLTDQLLKCSSLNKKAFGSGDSHDSGAYCVETNTTGKSFITSSSDSD